MVVIPVYPHAHGVSGPPQGQWSYSDWENLPDDGNRYEIIDGVLYMSTSPSYFHQWIVQRLYAFVGFAAEQQGLAFSALAPIGLLMPGCEPVQPDFVLVLAARASIIYDRRIRGVPDLIAEVLSPSSTVYDEEVKLAAYTRAGVPEYAVIDPEKRELRLYSLTSKGDYGLPKTYSVADVVTFACLPTIPLAVKRLFEGAPDTTL